MPENVKLLFCVYGDPPCEGFTVSNLLPNFMIVGVTVPEKSVWDTHSTTVERG